ncbi:MAG TPA: GNAT family N-acetyltransferase [Bacillota bacterium]|nr:GNAT family N-acetyltransferase [Bacillota bacterium]
MQNNLHLRVLEKDDLEFLHRLHNDPDVMDFWFSESHMSMEKLKHNHEKMLEEDSFRQFILTKDNERLGFVGLIRISPRHRNAEFVIMIDPSHQGNGYAKAATKQAMSYAFNQLNLHKLYLTVDKQNEKAIYIYENAGFQVEGEKKEHFFVNGSYHDVVSMYVLASDFFAGETEQ